MQEPQEKDLADLERQPDRTYPTIIAVLLIITLAGFLAIHSAQVHAQAHASDLEDQLQHTQAEAAGLQTQLNNTQLDLDQSQTTITSCKTAIHALIGASKAELQAIDDISHFGLVQGVSMSVPLIRHANDLIDAAAPDAHVCATG